MKRYLSCLISLMLVGMMMISASAEGNTTDSSDGISAPTTFTVRSYDSSTGKEITTDYTESLSSTRSMLGQSAESAPYFPVSSREMTQAVSDSKAIEHLTNIGVLDADGNIDEDVLSNLPNADDGSIRPRTVIGSDGRKLVSSPTSSPYRCIGYIVTTYPNGASYRGTAYTMGSYVAATAAHCLYNESRGGWATDVSFIPAYTNGSAPYGVFYGDLFHIGGNYYDGDSMDDWGMIEFDTAVGSKVGYMGMRKMTTALINSQVTVTGYPSEVGSSTNLKAMYTHTDACTNVANYHIYYLTDTSGGNSGSPIHQDSYAVGIHSKGYTSYNSGKGYDDWLYNFFMQYR